MSKLTSAQSRSCQFVHQTICSHLKICRTAHIATTQQLVSEMVKFYSNLPTTNIYQCRPSVLYAILGGQRTLISYQVSILRTVLPGKLNPTEIGSVENRFEIFYQP